ncbi:hypothetical protein C8R43DRAFT_439220 [Mycena crocata]|nr:hypothetical protein C8R43DRAFT_439220 [Mycena crocata]
MDSPLTQIQSLLGEHLHTNFIPSEAEANQIRAHIMPHSQKLSRLEAQSSVLTSYIQSHTALLSPVRQVPRDVLEQIFTACLPTNRNPVMSAREAPVLLGAICHGWREIAFSTPALCLRPVLEV